MQFKAICSVLISSLLILGPFLAFGQITQIPQSVSGGGVGAGKFAADVSSSTTWTVLGSTHALGTADLGIFVSFDTGTSYVKMEPDDCSVNKSTYDVTCTFASAQAGRIFLVGGTGGTGGGGDEFQANKNQANGYLGLDGTARAAKANQHGQTVYADQTITWASRSGVLDMLLGALILPGGNSRPASCSNGEIFYDSDATSGQRLYACEGSNNWVLQGGGGGSHASTHQHGGADEVATATPAGNAIPKAGSGGTLATGWLPTGTVGVLSTVVNNIDLASITNCEGSDRSTTVAGAVVGNYAVVIPPITNDVRMVFPAYVSGSNTVLWRACGLAGSGIDQPNGNYTVKVYYDLN